MVRGRDYNPLVEGQDPSGDDTLDEDGSIPQANDDDDLAATGLSKEAKVAKIYRELVYRPFIRRIRMVEYGWNGEGPVPPHLAAVCWQDGALGQMSSLTKEGSLDEDEELLITILKHSAARSAVEQPADVSPCFRALKALVRWLTKTDNLGDCPRFHKQLERGIQALEDEGRLNLKRHKFNAILLLIPLLPEIMSSAYSKKNVQLGFTGSGMILDSKTKAWPDLFELFGTYRGNYSNTVLADYQDLFSIFFMTMYVNGHIHEELYDQHSITDDRDLAGEIVGKYFVGIGSEHRQRAKIVSNKTQIDARRQRLAGIAYDRNQAALDKFQKEESTYELNKTCEEKVIAKIQKDLPADGKSASVVTAEPTHFGEGSTRDSDYPSLDEMKAFVKVRVKPTASGRYVPALKINSKRGAIVKCVTLKRSPVLPRSFTEPTRRTID